MPKRRHSYPHSPDQVDIQTENLRRRWAKEHEARMAAWDKFNTEEFQEEIRQQVLDETHADLLPPWATDPELPMQYE